jgi:TonB family protein
MDEQIGTASRWPWVALAIVGLGFCGMPHRLDAQPLGPSAPVATDKPGLVAAVPQALVQGHFAAKIPKNMHLNASTLVQVSLWDKTAEAQARAMLEAGPLVTSDVLVGRLLRVELAALHSDEFAIHAMTPAKQLLMAGQVARWEWTVVPLQPGAHDLSVVATNLADFPGKPLDRTAHSVTVNVEVSSGQGAGQETGPKKPALAANKRVDNHPGAAIDAEQIDKGHPTKPSTSSRVPSPEALQHALGLGAGSPDFVEDMDESDGTGLNAKKWRFAAFVNRVKRMVAAEWHPDELLSRHDPSGHIHGATDRTTVLKVQLDPDGRIIELKVARSSGVEFLDDEAMSSFRRAQPFNTPPPALIDSDGYIRFNFGFIVQLSGRTAFEFY